MDESLKQNSRRKARQSIGHITSQSHPSSIDKQNMTIDLSSAHGRKDPTAQKNKPKVRGKSLGPGGLEALRETDGNAVKNSLSVQLRSILKPTIPLTPPKTIPTFDELRQRSTRRKSPAESSTEALLIDFSTPGPNRDLSSEANTTTTQNAPDPFSPSKQFVGKDNSSVDVAGIDDQEKMRQEQKKSILEQRAARRKSMANRRVSFAPEATLHTWSVMELGEDSTMSSASNSTRRQSSITTQQTPDRTLQTPKTGINHHAVEQASSLMPKTSPINRGGIVQKKPRPSPVLTEDTSVYSDDVYSSSPSGDIAAGSSPVRVHDNIASDSDSDTDGDTAMSIEQLTRDTIDSQDSASSTHSSLEERLRQAATQAGTRGIEYDENDEHNEQDEYGEDVPMDLADDIITNAFQPWAKSRRRTPKAIRKHQDPRSTSSADRSDGFDTDQQAENNENLEMTMEMTQAIGSILTTKSSSSSNEHKTRPVKRQWSNVGRQQSLDLDSSYEDESMDLTTVAGGILSVGATEQAADTDDAHDGDVGLNVGAKSQSDTGVYRYDDSALSDENEIMDMTVAVGGILSPAKEQIKTQSYAADDQTVAMEMTKALGQIFSSQSSNNENNDDIDSGLHRDSRITSPGDLAAVAAANEPQADEQVIATTPKQFRQVASETGSPSLALKSRSSGRPRSTRSNQATTPTSSVKKAVAGQQLTPTKQLTPVPTRVRTPERTPVSIHIVKGSSSPKRLFRAEIKAKSEPKSAGKSPAKRKDPLFEQDDLSGHQTPRVVLHAPKPHQHLRRRSSGIGIDKEGFGSPRVTQLLSRRSSIADTAAQFRSEPSQALHPRFEDPVQLANEVDIEHAEDERRESGRFVMEQEANPQLEENATLQLKEMIESMTPKKSLPAKSKGRKSLAVGSAKGLLGKRPAELDDDETDSESTPKRLKAVSREGSPVKKVHLPKPPTKEETTGRLTKTEQTALNMSTGSEQTPVLGPHSPGSAVSSPQHSNRYKDFLCTASTDRPTSFEDKLDNVIGATDPVPENRTADDGTADDDKISLQHFLNMTNIHFIELNTTKRRHTLAKLTENKVALDRSRNVLKEGFVAAATTMPLLELYQHATRELKSYVSTGRKIIRSIESETLVDQPALFREYVDARPDVKLAMDNQFRNGKTNARLQSKEGWYTWRTQLVDGLHVGLDVIRNDLAKDLGIVEKQAEALARLVPRLTDRRNDLDNDLTTTQRRLQDLESTDHRALKASQRNLRSINSVLREKRGLLQSLQQQMQNKEEALSQAAELKEEIRQQICEADRIRIEHDSQSPKKVMALSSRLVRLREQTGWSLVSAEKDGNEHDNADVALAMSYKNALRLCFNPLLGGDQQQLTPSTSIGLTFSPVQDDDTPVPHLSIEQRLMVQLLERRLDALSKIPRASGQADTIFDLVSSGWETALRLTEEIRLLGLAGVTKVSVQGEETLVVKLMLVLPTKSRVDVEFVVSVAVSDNNKVSTSTTVSASAAYGPVSRLMDPSKTRKVQTALGKEVDTRSLGEGAWVGAVHSFEDWFRKQSEMPAKQEATIVNTGSELNDPILPNSPSKATSKDTLGKRSPLTMKKPTVVQKRTIPIASARQDKQKVFAREQQPQLSTVELPQAQAQVAMTSQGKENWDPNTHAAHYKAPAITPEMQEAMMQRTPIKRIGALRRSPI